MKLNHYLFCFIILCSCVDSKTETLEYSDQIGDTIFDTDLDDPDFKFCDSEHVLHKRAYVKYQGGNKGLEKELLELYDLKEIFQTFSGYIIVRYAINCKDQIDRIRLEVLDNDFNLKATPEGLESHIRNCFGKLKGWQHPIYDSQDYDGYSFCTLKFTNGKLKLI